MIKPLGDRIVIKVIEEVEFSFLTAQKKNLKKVKLVL